MVKKLCNKSWKLNNQRWFQVANVVFRKCAGVYWYGWGWNLNSNYVKLMCSTSGVRWSVVWFYSQLPTKQQV